MEGKGPEYWKTDRRWGSVLPATLPREPASKPLGCELLDGHRKESEAPHPGGLDVGGRQGARNSRGKDWVGCREDAQRERWECPFYWGLTKDDGLGDSLPDSAEELLQRGVGYIVYVHDLGEGIRVIKPTAQWKVAAGHEEQVSRLMILVLF